MVSPEAQELLELIRTRACSVAEAINLWKENGAVVSPQTVRSIMSNDKDGSIVGRRLDCAALAKSGNAQYKIQHYSLIADSVQRAVNHQRHHEHGAVTDGGVMTGVAETLRMPPNTVRLGLRNMRADIVQTDMLDPSPELSAILQDCAHSYIRDRVHDKQIRIFNKPLKELLLEATDGMSVSAFYPRLYEVGGTRGVGVWALYEVPLYRQHFATHQELTDYDMLVLEAYAQGVEDQFLSAAFRTSAGVPIDMESLYTHRNVLQGKAEHESVSVGK